MEARELLTRHIVENELSQKQQIFCVCGRLATGLHESMCRRFQKMVTNETNRRLAAAESIAEKINKEEP